MYEMMGLFEMMMKLLWMEAQQEVQKQCLLMHLVQGMQVWEKDPMSLQVVGSPHEIYSNKGHIKC